MLAALSEKAEKAEISIETLVFDINRDNFEQDNYDVVTCGMMLHHLENPSVLFEKAYGALKKGGCICVSDLLEEDGSFHDDAKGVHHSGFAADYISYLMKNTGFRDVSVETASVVKKQREHGEDSYPVFLAVGRK
jgi:2-polyprenyl-3-methyl-5-hydroxy-6-metoxy-1,4-benzoquinol methylase